MKQEESRLGYNPWRQCQGKRRHESQSAAVSALLLLKVKGDKKDVRTYLCPECHGWHIGHYNRKVGDNSV
jgi:hypothetical protein